MEHHSNEGWNMKRVTYLENEEQLNCCQREGIEEVILSPVMLSRFGSHDLEECYRLAKEARNKGLRPLLEWDILMSEKIFFQLKQTVLSSLQWQFFDAIRIQDKGALNYLLEKTSVSLQLILETGNHNIEGIKNILSWSQGRIERVVLSLELTQKKILQIIRQLPIAVEILGLGKILLYYSPRHLLHSSGQAMIRSLEGSQRNFTAWNNIHGTFIFHSRDRFILHLASELAREGLGALRIDLRFGGDYSLLPWIVRSTCQKPFPLAIKNLRRHWSVPLTQGFFQRNRTDLLFKKLKNSSLPPRDYRYIGEVLEIDKKSHVAVLVKSHQNTLSKGESIIFHTPEGRTRQMNIHSLRDTSLGERETIGQGEVGLLSPVSGLSVKSFVYRHLKKVR